MNIQSALIGGQTEKQAFLVKPKDGGIIELLSS
jgi:hypothetical protein